MTFICCLPAAVYIYTGAALIGRSQRNMTHCNGTGSLVCKEVWVNETGKSSSFVVTSF